MTTNKIVVIGTSIGGLKALRVVLGELPADLPASVFIVMHIGSWPSILPEILSRSCALPVRHAENGQSIEPAVIYIAPPDHHMMIAEGVIRLSRGAKENFARPAIDPLFRSAAVQYSDDVIGVVLTGALDDGAAGLRAISACGGLTIVQTPESCEAASMPLAAMRAVDVDRIVPLDEMGAAIVTAVHKRGFRGKQSMSERTSAEIETQFLLTGKSSPAELDKIGKSSKLTCPDCGGVVWRIGDGEPLRYRCHTGHAFSALSLDQAQADGAEDALWSAIRWLDERLLLAEDEALLAGNKQERHTSSLRTDIADIERARQALYELVLSNGLADAR